VNKSLLRPTVLIVTAALIVRVPLAYVLFGSVDLVNTIAAGDAAINGALYKNYPIPYFPLLSVAFYFGGVLERLTSWPVAFWYKLFPVIFDCAMAVLVFDLVRTHAGDERAALKAGLLYALCPIAIIMSVAQVQWDMIDLYLLYLALHIRTTYRYDAVSAATMGVLFTLSFLVKPYTVIFAVLLLPPCFDRMRAQFSFDRRFIARLLPLIGAGAATLLMGLAVMAFYGFQLLAIIHRIGAYATIRGVETFGLPFVAPFFPH